jgi:anti-sigma factor (TIGR02949 family)
MTHDPVSPIACAEVARRVWDYLDDQIETDLKGRIRRHLALCDHCQEHYTFEGEFLRALGRLVYAEDEPTPLRAQVERVLIEYCVPKDRAQ